MEMTFFYLFLCLIVAQRLTELWIARRNEQWMKEKGAREFGQNHYPIMILIHCGFFVSLSLEVLLLHKQLSALSYLFFTLFLIAQFIRIWIIATLGKYWNTKIIVLPNTSLIAKGPYKYMKHPNYLIVTLEFILIPLMFHAYYTLILFSLLNTVILRVRIPLEEKVLREWTKQEDGLI